MTFEELCAVLEQYAPTKYAYDWDNVGPLLHLHDDVKKVLLCLDITAEIVAEAREGGFDTIVAYHPIIFGAIKQVDMCTHTGKMIGLAAQAGLNIYALHTSFDTVPSGMNALMGSRLGLENMAPLLIEQVDSSEEPIQVTGIIGDLTEAMDEQHFAAFLKEKTGTPVVKAAGSVSKDIKRVAYVAGSGADFIAQAASAGADVLVTGEAKHNVYFEAMNLGILLAEVGHFDSEIHAVRQICCGLQNLCDALQYNIEVQYSVVEARPYRVL